MKQRLLLALLVLFASVGMVKAADTSTDLIFKVPKGEGKVTVTVKGATITSGSHPSIYYGSTDDGSTRATVSVTDQTHTATYTIDQNKDNEQTWKIPTDIVLSEISLSGKVVSFDATKVSSDDFKNGLKNLSFSNNGELSELFLWTIENEKGKVTAFPNLETLSCAGNKLKIIPEKGNIKNYTVGKQSPENLAIVNSDGTITSNEPLDLTLDHIKTGEYTIFRTAEGAGKTIVSYSSWKVTSDNKVGTAKKDNTYDYRYTFIESGNIYASETDFTCTLTIPSTNPQYPGVSIENIPVKVATAAFNVKAEVPNGNGTVKVYQDNTGKEEVAADAKVTKGTTLLITNVPNSNYMFDKDKTTTEGLKDIKWSGNNFTAIVTGDKAPVIKSAFKGKDCTITYTDKVEQGTLGVSIVDGAVVATNNKVPYGTKVEIVVVPTEGWAIAEVQANGVVVNANGEGKYITEITSDTRITVTYTNQQTKKVFWSYDAQVTPTVTGGGEWIKDPGKYHEVKTNTEVTFNVQFTSTNNQTYSIEAFLLDGTPLNATKKSDTEYVLSFIMPDHDVTITIKTLELTEVNINVEKEYTTVYNGEGQSMPYKISPNLTDNISILYKVSEANENLFTKTLPTEKGEYDVKFERPADKVYKAATVLVGSEAQGPSKYAKLKISAATPSIVTAPTVSVKKETKEGKETYSYAVTKGKAQLNSKTSLDGKWEVVENATSTGDGITAVPEGKEKATELVYVRFTAQNSGTDDPNYSPAYIQVPATVSGSSLNSFAVTIATLPEGTSLKLYNGAKEIKSGESVLSGTTLTAKMEAEGYQSAKVAAVDDLGKENPNISVAGSGKEYTVIITQKTKLGIIGTKKEYTKEIILNPDREQQQVNYSGKPQFYDLTSSVLKNKDGDVINKALKFPATVTYKNEQGQEVISPINAGIYTVTIEREAQGSYKAFKLTDKFIIKKMDPDVKNAKPVSTEIAIGQLLSQSKLNAAAPIAGSYQWVKDEKMTSAGNFTKAVKFVPLDGTNYNEVTLTNGVSVTVSNKTLITFAPINGKITVKDDKGKEYVAGSSVAKDTKLTVTAEPDEGFELKSFTVGNTTVSGNTYSFTFGEETVGIVAEFQLKTPNPAHVVITLPENGKGYKLSANGAKSVAFNANYTFTVSTLAADKDKVVVKAGGETIKANENGSYTVKGDKDKSIVVTLSNPTKLKVSVEQTAKNSKGFTLGTVEVEGLASDSTCYYNDEITLAAYPESGVTFAGWSDVTGNKDKVRTITVVSAMTIKPKFSGVPTGIESIEGTGIYGREGHIFIDCDGEARVILISMDGRARKIEISGDTNIPTEAGTYGVILEKGSEVMKTKVIVR